MTRIWIKKTPLCLALTLFALPAMADNIFSGVINFGREVLDETRKLAPGVQHDRRNEAPADVRAALDDGRDRPALDSSGNYQQGYNQSGNIQQGNRQSNIELPPPVNGQPTGSNLNYTYGESQRSNAPMVRSSGANANSNVNSNSNNMNNGALNDNRVANDGYYGSSDNAGYNQEQAAPQSNFGWQEESHLQ